MIYHRLLGYLRPYLGRLFTAVVCMVVMSGCVAALAWLLQPALDDALAPGHHRYIYLIPLGVIVLYLVKGAAYYGQTYLMGWVGQRVIHDLRNQLYQRITEQSLAFFSHRKTGELMARISADTLLVQGAVTTAVTSLMRDALSALFLLGVVFYQDWLLATIAFTVLPLVVYPIVRFGRRMRSATFDGQAALGAISSLVEETISGIRVVKAFAMEEYENRRFRRLTAEFFRCQMRVMRVQALSFPIMELLAGFGIAGVLLYGGVRISSGATTPGALVSFLAALIMLYEPVKRLSNANNVIQQGIAAAGRVFEVMDAPVAVRDPERPVAMAPFSRAIALEGVSLRYEGDARLVLDGIDLTVEYGRVVALVGSSGAGKSSLVNLIPRFMDPTEGRVTIDGVDLRRLSRRALRRQIALVTQEVVLFNDTVRNNLAYGFDQVDEERLHAAAQAANAHDFIMKLPQGYDTLIGERGVILSGGQRQRLALARALFKDAPILILDEATSALDSESERLVQQAIDRLMAGRTTIVIAHRLSTIRHADTIVVLDRGRIVQQGRHEELLARGGRYRELYELQFADG
ncbi:MAG: lipid A export permease/ATP-binding protein MsbA [Zetaproteobacteria bacterium]|nr:MAG: lipid A export permease/ATP-binding protein MsbA [Zetaproteobacteria bacterium]